MTQQDLIELGYTDERGLFTAAKIVKGIFDYNGTAQHLRGMVFLCIKGDTLNIYDEVSFGEIGEKITSFDIQRMSELKTSSFIFNPYLQFCYNGIVFKFNNFANAKLILNVITESNQG